MSLLRRFIESWNEALNENGESEQVKLNIENYIEFYVKQLSGESTNQNEVVKSLSSKTMGTFYFPYVTEFKEFQNQKVRHYEKLSSIAQLDSLDTVAARPLEFSVKASIPFASLAIPVTYRLNGYGRGESARAYVARHEGRWLSLRRGAEDELTQIDAGLVERMAPEKEEEEEEEEASQPLDGRVEVAIKDGNEAGAKIIDLEPSHQLSEPVEYSPMHIFVSCLFLLDQWF